MWHTTLFTLKGMHTPSWHHSTNCAFYFLLTIGGNCECGRKGARCVPMRAASSSVIIQAFRDLQVRARSTCTLPVDETQAGWLTSMAALANDYG